MDTKSKITQRKENTVREYYSKIYKNEAHTLDKKNITIKSYINTGQNRTKKRIPVRIKASTLKKQQPILIKTPSTNLT